MAFSPSRPHPTASLACRSPFAVATWMPLPYVQRQVNAALSGQYQAVSTRSLPFSLSERLKPAKAVVHPTGPQVQTGQHHEAQHGEPMRAVATDMHADTRGAWQQQQSMAAVLAADSTPPHAGTGMGYHAESTQPFNPWDRLGASPSPLPLRTCLLGVRVKDFALVSEQVVAFGSGLTAITGESGSGKSVLVEALGQVLGAPAPLECVRAPASQAVIEGAFWICADLSDAVRATLLDQGVPRKALPPSGQGSRLDVRREILLQEEDGSQRLRSRCFVNGVPVTLRALRALGTGLVDMNGQHSSVELADSEVQLALLDRVAGCGALATQVAEGLAAMRALEDRLEALDALSDERERSLMQRMVEAVRKERITPGEEVKLRTAVRMMDARRLAAEQCAAARASIVGDGSGGAAGGGLLGALRAVETQLKGVMTRENTAAATPGAPSNRARGGSQAPFTTRDALSDSESKVASGQGVQGEEVEEEEEEDLYEKPGSSGSESEGEGIKAQGTRRARRGQEEEEEEEEEDGPRSQLQKALDALALARQQLSAAEVAVKGYARASAFNALEYDSMSERLSKIDRLLRAHRCRTTQDLVKKADEAEQALAEYEEQADHVDEWEQELDELRGQVIEECLELSRARRAAAPALSAHVEQALGALAMGGARFHVSISWTPEPDSANMRESEALDIPASLASEILEASSISSTSSSGRPAGNGRTTAYRVRRTGLDDVQLCIAAGPAEPLRPLSAVASGGECARIMLALKAAPCAAAEARAAASGDGLNGDGDGSNAEEVVTLAPEQLQPGAAPILIFDELDSGVGSRLGSSVGAMLRRMAGETHGGRQSSAGGSQIICVTHLPQVAAAATTHVRVAKGAEEQGGGRPARITTRFEHLTAFEERSREVADMMGMDVGLAADMLRAGGAAH